MVQFLHVNPQDFRNNPVDCQKMNWGIPTFYIFWPCPSQVIQGLLVTSCYVCYVHHVISCYIMLQIHICNGGAQSAFCWAWRLFRRSSWASYQVADRWMWRNLDSRRNRYLWIGSSGFHQQALDLKKTYPMFGNQIVQVRRFSDVRKWGLPHRSWWVRRASAVAIGACRGWASLSFAHAMPCGSKSVKTESVKAESTEYSRQIQTATNQPKSPLHF